MPRFLVQPTDQRHAAGEIIARDAGGVLAMVQRLDCKEAAITKDGEYIFSVRLGDNGLWAIFQRDSIGGGDNVIRLFG